MILRALYMRKTHQKTKILYEIRSEINFFKRGKKRQVTYYGSDTPISKFNLIKRAEDNIKKKFDIGVSLP